VKHVLPCPVPAFGGGGVYMVALGEYHTAAITKTGQLYTWGNGWSGRLGLGDEAVAQAIKSCDRCRAVRTTPWRSPTMELCIRGGMERMGG